MNMRIISFILFLFFISTSNTYADKDRAIVSIDILQNRSINSSDLIFLGKLNGIDTINGTLNFKILEKFKGDNKSDSITIKGGESTPIYFIDKSLWLVYVNCNVDSSFILNENGLSRSIIHPEIIHAYIFPPPPPLKYEINEVFTYTDKWVSYRITALKDWYVELELLRNYKRDNFKYEEMKRIDYMPYFYSSLLCILFCLGLIFYLLYKLKKTNR
ncbi:MAG: hypothetical protein JXB49_36840 [Bacteroidales bacterium]|nr:hypothetical protein [Bacteroidales bacterium]